MQRTIIRIDESKCNGCGDCIPNCPEGALRIVEGKARLVRDMLCDGLGACLGHCPEGAINVEVREAEAYDERSVIANIIPQGKNAIESHLKHLKEHNDTESLRVALEHLKNQAGLVNLDPGGARGEVSIRRPGGCPGSQSASFAPGVPQAAQPQSRSSELTHWPIQLHLINPMAPHFADSDLLLAADCVPFSIGNFHTDYLRGKTLAIGCPKLDDGQEVYLTKLVDLIDSAKIQSLNVMIMQVPCCAGLFQLARKAVERASRKVPIHYQVIGIRGEPLQQGTV